MLRNKFQSLLYKAIVIVAAVSLGGCVTKSGLPLEELEQERQEAYRVHPGDILNVRVWGEPGLSGDVVVREDGQLTLQLINDVPASGKTLEELAKEVEGRLKKFIPGVGVSISVTQSAPIRYYLLGKFNKSGEMRSTGKITLLQAIATGGSFLPFANTSEIVLIRHSSEGEKRYVFDYQKVLDGRQPNPDLREGDTINVQ